ncbi:MAG TPA: glycosyltransferase [Gammaproteobacteria bacterium]|nr:glycosyltransferase [Gammaproteobacteria bacterium]
MLKILTFSLLYPNEYDPRHGIFVEQRLRKLVESGEVTARVVAPVPWFPFKSSLFGRYAMYALVPHSDIRHGIPVLHPRFPSIPKVGMSIGPKLLARAMERVLRGIIAGGYDFDVIDAHYFYPDGVAAVWLGQALKKPVTVTCRGDDVMYFSRFRAPRRMMLNAATKAAGIVTVSEDLRRRLGAMGVPPDRVMTLRNGVDTRLFRPVDRAAVRRSLGLKRPMLLSVGHLVERKGHHLAIEALKALPDFDLVIIGERGTEAGGMVDELYQQVADFGLTDRVRFLGNLPQEQLRSWYGAADALVLATDREGMPNVMLESLACGTPVVATPAGGIPEVMTEPEAGVLIKERTPDGVVTAVKTLFEHYPDRSETRRFAETLGWEATTRGQIKLFRRALHESGLGVERRGGMTPAARNC